MQASQAVGSGTARAFVRWADPAIPAGCNITSVNVTLTYVAADNTNQRTIFIEQFGAAGFTEGTVWNNQPGVDPPPFQSFVVPISASGSQAVSFNIGSAPYWFSPWVRGIRLRDSTDTGSGVISFITRDSANVNERPRLVVTYA